MSFLDRLKGQNPALPTQTINLGPGDHYIVISIPNNTESLSVVQSEHTDPLTLAAMLIGALQIVYQKILEQHPPEDRRIVPPPPGAVLKQ